ncbi:MAG: polysaccharide deacetylase, partial [Pseudomonadota bacterium]
GREYADCLIQQYERLAAEGERTGSGTVMCIPLHAYLIGQPHRIGPFEEALRHIAADNRVWKARAGDIVDCWRAQQ